MKHASNPFASFTTHFRLELIEPPQEIVGIQNDHDRAARLDPDVRRLFELRHSVYCEEFQYDPLQPSGMEVDPDDDRAWHAVLRYIGQEGEKRQGELAGCVRVVYNEPESGRTRLPFEKHYDRPYYPGKKTPDQSPPETSCEISRLAVHRHFRQRPKEQQAKEGAIDDHQGHEDAIAMSREDQLRTFPLLAASLFAAAGFLFLHHQKKHIFVMMEPKLHRRLNGREGVRFEQIGEPTEFRGLRAPYYLDAAEGEVALNHSPNLSPLYAIVREQLSAHLR